MTENPEMGNTGSFGKVKLGGLNSGQERMRPAGQRKLIFP